MGDNEVKLVWSEAEMVAALGRMVSEHAPSRFVLCEVQGEADQLTNGWVHVYGLAWPDHAVTWCPESRGTGTHPSAEAALRMWSFGHDLRLIWVDPSPN